MMTQEMISKLKRSLIEHEGSKKFPYCDTAGKITIGIGYNLTDRGIDEDWIHAQYMKDITYFYSQLSDFLWFRELNEDRQIALIDMCFMGFKNFMEFKKMISALEEKDYARAALEILKSQWAKQVNSRASTLAQAILTGTYPI